MAREKTEKGKETRVFQCFLPTPLASVFVSFVIVIFLEFENSPLAWWLVGWSVDQPGLDECALFICLEFENLLSAGS